MKCDVRSVGTGPASSSASARVMHISWREHLHEPQLCGSDTSPLWSSPGRYRSDPVGGKPCRAARGCAFPARRTARTRPAVRSRRAWVVVHPRRRRDRRTWLTFAARVSMSIGPGCPGAGVRVSAKPSRPESSHRGWRAVVAPYSRLLPSSISALTIRTRVPRFTATSSRTAVVFNRRWLPWGCPA